MAIVILHQAYWLIVPLLFIIIARYHANAEPLVQLRQPYRIFREPSPSEGLGVARAATERASKTLSSSPKSGVDFELYQ